MILYRHRDKVWFGVAVAVMIASFCVHHYAQWRHMSSETHPHVVAFIDMAFVDDNHGWATGPGLVETIDGGKQWHPRGLCDDVFDWTVEFADEQDGWIGGGLRGADGDPATQAVILHTTNGGVDWTKQVLDVGSVVTVIDRSSDGVLWCNGDRGVARSEDSGNTWTVVMKNNGQALVPSGSSASAERYIAITDGGDLMITADKGRTWMTRRLGQGVRPVGVGMRGRFGVMIAWDMPNAAMSKARTLAESDQLPTIPAFIYFTSDYGMTWRRADAPTHETFFAVGFSEDSWWVVGSRGLILRGSPDGQRWSKCFSPTSNDLTCVSLGLTSHLWIAGDHMTTLRRRW